MKKMLAILLSAVMVLALLAGCGSKDNDKNKDSDTQGGDASALNVAVFYYDFSDVYISSVRNSMEEQFNAMGIKPSNYDGAGNQAQQTDQINTAISNGANLLIVNIVETSSPDAAQNAVEAQEFTASVGGGVVEAKVNGKKEVLAVTIKPEAVDPEDVEMLQDMITAAVNEALRGVAELGAQRINAATGGMSIPGLM